MYDFLLVTNSNLGRICYLFRDINTYRYTKKLCYRKDDRAMRDI